MSEPLTAIRAFIEQQLGLATLSDPDHWQSARPLLNDAVVALQELDAPRALTGPGEREKRAPCVHGNPCREAQCVEYGRWDAMPAPPDELQRLTEALEVEALARALRAILFGEPQDVFDSLPDRLKLIWRVRAKNIAAVYDALRAATPPVEPEGSDK